MLFKKPCRQYIKDTVERGFVQDPCNDSSSEICGKKPCGQRHINYSHKGSKTSTCCLRSHVGSTSRTQDLLGHLAITCNNSSSETFANWSKEMSALTLQETSNIWTLSLVVHLSTSSRILLTLPIKNSPKEFARSMVLSLWGAGLESLVSNSFKILPNFPQISYVAALFSELYDLGFMHQRKRNTSFLSGHTNLRICAIIAGQMIQPIMLSLSQIYTTLMLLNMFR